MKSLVQLLLCLVLMSPAYGSEAKWFFVSRTKSFASFIDVAFKHRQGDIVLTRDVYNYKELKTTEDGLQKYRSVLGYVLYDCELNRSSIFSMRFYAENFARGDQVKFYHFKEPEWQDIKENSIEEGVFEAACNEVREAEVY